MIPPPVILMSGGSGSEPVGPNYLTISESVQTLVAETWNFGDRTPSTIGDIYPSVIFDSQERTLCSTAMPWNSNYVCHGGIIYYDQYGLYPAHIETTQKQSDPDRHLYPAIVENNSGDIITVQEGQHIGAPRSYKGPADLSKFIISGPTGLNLVARPQMYKLSSGFALLYQQDEQDIYVTTCDEDGTNWTTARLVVLSSGARIYFDPVIGSYKPDADGWYYFTVEPHFSSGAFVRVSYLLKTQDFVTFSNYQETHSFVSTTISGITQSDLGINGYSVVTGSVEIGLGAYCVDTDSNIFRVEFRQAGDTTLNTWRWNGSAWVSNTSVTTHNFVGSGWDGNRGCLKYAFVRGSRLYLIATISNGTVGKPHLMYTEDLGLNWVDEGDMLPGISEVVGYYSIMGPANINDVPDNKNFIFYASEGVLTGITAQFADMYIIKAAFGTIQSEVSRPAATPVTAINDISGAKYIYETDNMSGTNFVDKSSVGRVVTSVGTPTLTSGEQIYNGTNQANVPTAAGFDDSEATIVIVGRPKDVLTGTVRYFHSWSLSSANDRFCMVGTQIGFGPRWAFTSNSEPSFVCYGVDNVHDDAFKIFVYKIDGKHIRFYVNGKEANKVYDFSGNMQSKGLWNSVLGDNANRIASLDRSSSDSYSAVGIKADAYWGRILTIVEQRSLEQFLATKYSITLEG